MQLADRRLYLLFTPGLCAGPPWRALEAALRGGVDLVQWRVAGPDLQGFQRCRELCGVRGVPLLVNDDVMLAVRGRAHGAHIGQDDMPVEVARRLLAEAWLGVSTHDVVQVRAAAEAGADYVGFGPCHPTATKGYAEGLPPAAIEEAVGAARVPLFAIGGIRADNVPLLRGLGVRRIAVSSAILAAADPEAAAAALRDALP